MKLATPSIPVFKLYGESLDWPTPDLLHCESIPKRSSLYHWEIEPHRHADLYQFLYVEHGQAVVEIEGRRTEVLEAAIHVTPPMCVHGFQFSADVEGYVLSIAAPLVTQLEAQLGAPLTVLASAGSYPVGRHRHHVNNLFSNLLAEYEGNATARDLVLHSLVNMLMVWIIRSSQRPPLPEGGNERNRQLLGRFMALVEKHYREHLTVDRFAHQLGISSTSLNTLCRELAGLTALQIVHQRLLLEAKRNLIYTRVTVYQLSDSLGFSDPTYFSRFFRRLSGQSPNAFRRAAGQDAPPRR